MTPLSYTELHSGGLITTYACSSACAHCVYRSSPKRQHDSITFETATDAFRTVRTLGCRAMHIGGGEPFLDVEALMQALSAARAERVDIDYIETNGSWFKDEASARDVLREVRHHGCDTLLVSIDPFHNAFIPFRKTRGVMEACRRAGMSVFPWRLEFQGDIDRFDDALPHRLEDYEEAYGPGYLRDLESRYGVNLGGRALTTFRRFHPMRPLNEILSEGQRGCAVLANGSHFHIDLHGDFIPTHCPGFGVKLADLGRPLPPATAPALTCLYSEGPTALYRQAVNRGFRPRDGYISPCDLCDHMRGFLAINTPDAYPDLRPVEFYTIDETESRF